MRKVAKARTHSLCGNPLDGVVVCEVIPAGYYTFANKYYQESILPEDSPELITELRCAHCNEALKHADLEYVQKRWVETPEERG